MEGEKRQGDLQMTVMLMAESGKTTVNVTIERPQE